LKPWTIQQNPTTITSFYRTYEELKHEDLAQADCWGPRFYRTYEELKLAFEQYEGRDEDIVFIVPMRN